MVFTRKALGLCCLPLLANGEQIVQFLAPRNHNLLFHVFGSEENAREPCTCCADLAAGSRDDCYNAHERDGASRYWNQQLCCSSTGWNISSSSGFFMLHLLASPGFVTADPQLRMYPLARNAFCVAQESSRLLQVLQQLQRCLTPASTKAFRSCMERVILNAEKQNTSSVIPAKLCWPSAAKYGWPDVFAALRTALHSVLAVRETAQVINTYIYEVNQLKLGDPWAASPLSHLRLPRATMSNHPAMKTSDFESMGVEHRGTTLIRLLRETFHSRPTFHLRPEGPKEKKGLVMVELGTYNAEMTRYLAQFGAGLLSELHTVDWYEYNSTLQALYAKPFEELGFEPCAAPWYMVHPVISFCSLLGPRVFLHMAMTTDDPVGVVGDQAVDVVFVDADHFYEPVVADVGAWRHKVSPGGILAGHDFRYGVGGTREAVLDVLPEQDIFLDSDSVWWTRM